MKEKKIYYRRLDVVRNISCFMVLLYHLNILRGGFLAVCTFFALSGYLTCMSALKKQSFSIKSYYLSRLKTLYLPLLIVVFTTIITYRLLPNITWLNLKKETTSVIFGYNNYWQLQTNMDYFTKNVNSPFVHLWYISILMQFELIFPFIFVVLKKLKDKGKESFNFIILFLLTIFTTILFFYMSSTKSIMEVYYNSLARAFSILFGMILALIHFEYKNKFTKFGKINNNIIFIVYLIIFILLSIFVSAESKLFAVFMFITTIISIRLIKYSTINIKESYKFEKLNKYLAKISYEIYLVQYPIIFFMQNLPINMFLKTLLIVFLTFIISCIIHFIINFKDKIKSLQGIKILIIILIITVGTLFLIKEQDHMNEMKELEELLNENSEVTEQKNNAYINTMETEKPEETGINKESETGEKENNKEDILNNQSQTNGKNNVKKIQNPDTQNQEELANKVSGIQVVGIGDSVLLGASKELYKKFPNGYFDGKVSRTLSAGETVLKELKSKGKLGNIIILALANNGDYSTKKNKELMEIVEKREVFWINAVGADDPTFNDKFKKFAENYPNIHIVEWDRVSKGHKEYFYADGIHTKDEGIKKYAETIYEAIYNYYSKSPQ